ncbi:type I-C CRISPR-associated protein Cas7/Csd2 [Terriglobus sp.]|uniref:type I-C CRISPR-associated protein Cas7/Csd2 n=1 Tax=Terriglobus sp. TaxID=1889013 RepID=UPI003B0074BF
MTQPVQNRYDFVFFFDVTDGNPNGDPDAGNLPRIDPETNQGLVTDVCLKRKIRNYVADTTTAADADSDVESAAPQFNIYVRERGVLNAEHRKAYSALRLDPEPKKLPKNEADARRLTKWMCLNFFDIRAFGAVMTTEVNAGQVRGPIQFTFARSLDPIVSAEFAITRCAVTKEKEEKEREIGRKFTVPYGLYRGYGFINASLAGQTGFSEDDLALFKQALNSMFELDRSAARGLMSPVRCIAFRHEKSTGNARADVLFDKVTARLKPELHAENRPPRSRHDYTIQVTGELPEGITVEEWV